MPAQSLKKLFTLFFYIAFFSLCTACIDNRVPIRNPDGDSGSFPENYQPPKGTGKPYTVHGKTYYPLVTSNGFSEEGLASWYGQDFHGKTTSNGEIYDMYGMTAAHKLLPFGTQVKVTRLDNGKSIVVRVNDRGPFVAGRIIDLTKTGAEKLDMLGVGTAKVRLETVGAVEGMTSTDLSGKFYVQIGAFSIKDNAENLAQNLRNAGKTVRVVYVDSISFWRVQVGPWQQLSQAEQNHAQLLEDFPEAFLVAD